MEIPQGGARWLLGVQSGATCRYAECYFYDDARRFADLIASHMGSGDVLGVAIYDKQDAGYPDWVRGVWREDMA